MRINYLLCTTMWRNLRKTDNMYPQFIYFLALLLSELYCPWPRARSSRKVVRLRESEENWKPLRCNNAPMSLVDGGLLMSGVTWDSTFRTVLTFTARACNTLVWVTLFLPGPSISLLSSPYSIAASVGRHNCLARTPCFKYLLCLITWRNLPKADKMYPQFIIFNVTQST